MNGLVCGLNVNTVIENPPELKYAKIPVRNNKPPLNKVFVVVPRILYFFFWSPFEPSQSKSLKIEK